MQSTDMTALAAQVLWASFFLSTLFGILAQRTHFCTMGAVSDIVNIGDWTRMRQWVLAIGVGMIGFALLSFSGQIDPTKIIYASNRFIWLSALVGGGLFGFGMVLASGCGSKTLVRIGGGSLKSLIVFIVLGVSSFATLKGITAVLRVNTVDQIAIDIDVGTLLPQLISDVFNIKSAWIGLVAGCLIGSALVVWALSRSDFRRVENLLAGLGIGGIVVAMWWVTGSLGFVAEHPDTLQEVFLATSSGKAESLSFVAPVAYSLDWLMFFSDKNKLLTTGVVSVAGVVVGSWAQAIWQKSFRWEGFGGTEDVANHLTGATLMGIGGVTAMGCTVGQGLSGVSTLSLVSFVSVAGIVFGAVLALKYQVWRLGGLD